MKTMKKQTIRIIALFLLIIAAVLWQMYLPNNVLYGAIYFLVTMITYISASLLKINRPLLATIFFAVGLFLSIFLKRNFVFEDLITVGLWCLLSVIVIFFIDKKVNN